MMTKDLAALVAVLASSCIVYTLIGSSSRADRIGQVYNVRRIGVPLTNMTSRIIDLTSSISSSADVALTVKDTIDSATGSLFDGKRIRTFDRPMRFRNYIPSKHHPLSTDSGCTKWNVVTTIYAPTVAVKRAASVPGWCTVIVADTKTPDNYMEEANFVRAESVHYLSVQDQLEWANSLRSKSSQGDGADTAETKNVVNSISAFVDAIPLRHFSRKNIGYLYAIQHGAELIFDFDDDNLLDIDKYSGRVVDPLLDFDGLHNAREVVVGPSVFNHHQLMGAQLDNYPEQTSLNNTFTSWPRGFSLSHLQDVSTRGQVVYTNKKVPLQDIAVMQYCANNNPDVDAIHRLVHPLPMSFVQQNQPQHPLLVPSHSFAVYNAQATLHTHDAFWGLLLPFTVPGRVSDIWRGYFAQVLFRELGLRLAFLSPRVSQDRNEHNYLADMNAELDLYFKVDELVAFLEDWTCSAATVPECMEQLWIDLYERDYIGVNDVLLVQLWLDALIASGYKFPELKPKSQRQRNDVVLMGQFNYPNKLPDVLYWVQKYRTYFRHIVVRGPFSSDDISAMHAHGINAHASEDDRGFVSPLRNLLETVQEYRNVDGIVGVMYSHDDALLNVTSIFADNFDYSNTIMEAMTPSAFQNNEGSDYSVVEPGHYIYKDKHIHGQQSDLIGKLIDWDWQWHNQCVSSFEKVVADARSTKYKDTKSNAFYVPQKRQSDFYYVPTSVADEFTDIAELLLDYSVFLECGFPTVSYALMQQTKVKSQSLTLCTSWTGERDRLAMIEKCPPSQVYHPYKLSHGYEAWGNALDQVVYKNKP